MPAESVLPWREGLVACMHTREEKRGVAMLKAASRAMKMSGARGSAAGRTRQEG